MVIVAHPDDETLWAGGTILMHPETNWTIVVLCKKNDPDRSVRFNRALDLLQAQGRMGDLDDGPRQTPLSDSEVHEAVLGLLSPGSAADRVIRLPRNVWKSKYDILTRTYGFGPRSFEARTTPAVEAFWCCGSRQDARLPRRKGA